jgi:hypothetical protein
MSLYRRRIFIYCIILFLLIAQPLFYIFYLSGPHCENKLPVSLLENITDREKIINLNTKILCWIPTTIKRLDRAIVVHE